MTTKTLQPEIDHGTGYFDVAGFAAAALANAPALAAVFDHTLLKPEATREQVVKLCEEAAAHRLAHSVMVGSGVPVGVVVGFPLGANLATTKREESLALIKLGAHELDMVMNLGLLKSGMSALVEQDIRGVVQVAHDAGALVKVILETSLLSVEEKLRASELALAAGADFLKTSTGFSTGGATVADVAILRGVAGNRCGVKASGGIRTLSEARAMLEAGATRIGASASVAILRQYQEEHA
jgi:deoxyribose-phosphate aldolase